MDHQQATTIHAAERYLLGELSPEEREAFEAHYFDCSQCAEDVRTVFMFESNTRAFFAGQPVPRPAASAAGSHGWRDWLRGAFSPSAWLRPAYATALAAVIFLGVNGYQWQAGRALRAELDQLNSAQVPASLLLRPMARSRAEAIQVGRADRFVVLEFEPPAGAAHYQCEVRAASGATTHRAVVTAPKPGHLAKLVLPASQLPTGGYEVVVRGQPDSPHSQPGEERYRFTLQRN